jgi:hypothetical protein
MTEFDLIQKPEYIHVVLNHLPIYGSILGALALAISLVLRSRAAQITESNGQKRVFPCLR